MIRAVLYDAEGHDREIALPDEGLPAVAGHQLLWIDAVGASPEELARLSGLLDLRPQSMADMQTGRRTFSLANYGHYVHFDVPALDLEKTATPSAKPSRTRRLDVFIGGGWLLTAHDHALRFIEDFREQDRGETLIGVLTPAALAASLLDWHLAAYLTALEEVESFTDRVDVRLLSSSSVRDDLLQELVSTRRYISSLRRSLAPQSAIFYGLSRPDIAVIHRDGDDDPFPNLERRFERVLDAVEHGRSLVQSSFDLFTTRTAETTNMLIRRLTLLSVLLGALGGIAGVFGMNFDTPYPKSGLLGFWLVVGCFAAFTVLAVLVARLRKWI